ncbi:MAG: Maf family protein [Thermoleophilia bacterium]|nr:Maf family protein [Thermoleophilia bacterium]
MYLASRSPQRKALLKALGVMFEVVHPDYLEENTGDHLPAEQVERHSRGKAFSILSEVEPLPSDRPIIGVDTMVVIHGQAVGKAVDEEEALGYLRGMSGKTHLVYSGLTLLWSGTGPGERVEATSHSVTEVRFSRLTEREIESYLDTGEWRDRAGAYAIQGRASAFVEEIRGDYTNVVGLPVPLLASMLRDKGQWPPAGWINHG